MQNTLYEKRLTHILEISGPIGMFVVTPPGIPSPKRPSLLFYRQSPPSTWEWRSPGTLFLDSVLTRRGSIEPPSSEGVLTEEVAWRIFSAYCFGLGFIHIRGITAEKLQSGSPHERTMATKVFRNPHYSSLLREGEWRSTNPYSNRPIAEGIVPRGNSSTELAMRRILKPGIRRELMILATRIGVDPNTEGGLTKSSRIDTRTQNLVLGSSLSWKEEGRKEVKGDEDYPSKV